MIAFAPGCATWALNPDLNCTDGKRVANSVSWQGPEEIGRVPHVRPTRPGLPWGVHGPKKVGAALRSLLPFDRKIRPR
jgi:hypothetical protein